MKRIVLSVSVALVAVFALANIALAQEWNEAAQYRVEVMGTDDVSGGQGVWINRWSNELADRWQRTYEWTPMKPITIYLYSSGTSMADAVGTFRGTALSDTAMREVATQQEVFTLMDPRSTSAGGTGGWLILVNLNSGQFGTGIGTTNWSNQVEAAMVHEMAHLMVSDLAGEMGPMWLHVGLVNYIVQTEAPEWLAPRQRTTALNSRISAGVAPGLVALHNGWDTVTGMSPMMSDASYAVATKTVQYLVPRVGVKGLINLLKDSQMGGDFNGMLMRLTGQSLTQLDQAYRNVL